MFDKKARKAFLEWFAATGNVVWSAEKVGFSDKTVWKHRMNDPRFAEAFDWAFEQSLMRNKARIVERKAKETPIAIDGGVAEAELEDCDLEKAWPLIVEMAGLTYGGGHDGPGRSPDRLDDEHAAMPPAWLRITGGNPHLLMVWAMSELVQPKAEPRISRL